MINKAHIIKMSISTTYADTDKFSWKELPIISKPFTFRQLIPEQLCKYITQQDLLDHNITKFQYVPCTQIYILTDDNDEITIYVGIRTTELNELWYDDVNKNDCHICFLYQNKMKIESLKNETISFEDISQYNTISHVNQDIMDSIRVECDGKYYTKDAMLA